MLPDPLTVKVLTEQDDLAQAHSVPYVVTSSGLTNVVERHRAGYSFEASMLEGWICPAGQYAHQFKMPDRIKTMRMTTGKGSKRADRFTIRLETDQELPEGRSTIKPLVVQVSVEIPAVGIVGEHVSAAIETLAGVLTNISIPYGLASEVTHEGAAGVFIQGVSLEDVTPDYGAVFGRVVANFEL